MTENMSDQQAEQLMRDLMKEKANAISFFTDIIKSDDTIKTGNLELTELGEPRLPLRSLKGLELFSKDIYEDAEWESYFKKKGEILTSTSLSKDAILIKLAVTSKKELADVTPKEKKKNKGWFKKN